MEKQRLLQRLELIRMVTSHPPLLPSPARGEGKMKELGFTLIELILVIAVISVLLASYTSFFAVKSGAGIRIHYTANQIATDLRLAQSLAMSVNQRYQVSFAASSYSVTDVNNNPAWLNSGAINLPSGISVTSSTPASIIFNGRGIPYVNSNTPLSNTFSVILQTTSSDQRTVNVSPDTGNVGVTNP